MIQPSAVKQLGRRLKFRDLQVFFEVVEAGSMAGAAAVLGLTQPAVSEIIAQLEQMFAIRLFDRSTRGVELTIYGRALLKRARAAFDEIRQSAEEIDFLADPNIGEVRIGVIAQADVRSAGPAGKGKPFKVRRMASSAPMAFRRAVSITDLMSA
jgi:DNA-binding transcriptional LysR family regulator